MLKFQDSCFKYYNFIKSYYKNHIPNLRNIKLNKIKSYTHYKLYIFPCFCVKEKKHSQYVFFNLTYITDKKNFQHSLKGVNELKIQNLKPI